MSHTIIEQQKKNTQEIKRLNRVVDKLEQAIRDSIASQKVINATMEFQFNYMNKKINKTDTKIDKHICEDYPHQI